MLNKRSRRAIFARSYIECGAFLLLFSYLAYNVYGIQIKHHDHFYKLSVGLSTENRIYEDAARGKICDKNGNLFACDVSTMDVMVEPKRFSAKMDKVISIICKNLDDLKPDDVRQRFEKALAFRFPVTVTEVEALKKSQLSALSLEGVERQLVRKPGNDGESQKILTRIIFRPGIESTPKLRKTIHELAVTFDCDEEELNVKCDKARKRFNEIVLVRNIPREKGLALKDELRANGLSAGMRFADSWERRYPRNNELANMLGFTDNDREGVFGIEALMNNYLKPTRGIASYKHDRYRRPVGDGHVYKVKPTPGADVYLTIQEPLQQIVEEELAVMWEKNDPVRAYAIMMDPMTGEIMALAQYPQINPNERETLTDPARCQTPCLVQAYDPGSIMKAVSLTGVLQSRLATLNTMVDCESGRWYYGGRPLRDSHSYNDLTLAEVIQKSSNIGTAKFSLMLGEEEMFKHLNSFGLGKRTGVGFYPPNQEPVVFKSEARGSFRAFRNWDSLTITRIPMGQGVSLTPMQIMQTWSALANGGTIMQPYIVDHVKYPDGHTEYSEPHVKYNAVSESAVKQMTEALKMVTQKGGTGTRAAVPGYDVAGKTGTAQFWIPANPKTGTKGHYSEREYFASFIGFVPASNPRFLLLVSAENPRKGYHTGSGVSAPVFGRIAARTLEYLQVPPDYTPETKSSATAAR